MWEHLYYVAYYDRLEMKMGAGEEAPKGLDSHEYVQKVVLTVGYRGHFFFFFHRLHIVCLCIIIHM